MTAFLQSWLFAWLFMLSLSLGAMANLMVFSLTGGRWGEAIRPALEGATRLVPLVAIFFIPVLAGAAWLYPWVHHEGRWLNLPFFAGRSVAYLAILSAWSIALTRAAPERRGRISASGLIVYGLTMSLASVDWIASLTPGWHSSGFGLVVCVGQMLAGMAFAVAAASGGRRVRGEVAGDLGNLLLMYVLTWAYLAYTQFLIIWSENLPSEIAWYVPRVQTGWSALALVLVVFHFFLPLAILLSRSAKRAPALLNAIAVALVAAHVADVFWLVMPAFRPSGFSIAWTDVLLLVLLGGGWLFAWRRASVRTVASHV